MMMSESSGGRLWKGEGRWARTKLVGLMKENLSVLNTVLSCLSKVTKLNSSSQNFIFF